MKRLSITLVVVLVLAGIFFYVVLPAVIEDQFARRLQEGFGLPTKPDVEVSSSFPPELLLGRIDGVRVNADQINLQGAAFGGAQADLTDVNVSVPNLLQGDLSIEAQGCSLSAEVPALSISESQVCLTYLGLAGG